MPIDDQEALKQWIRENRDLFGQFFVQAQAIIINLHRDSVTTTDYDYAVRMFFELAERMAYHYWARYVRSERVH